MATPTLSVSVTNYNYAAFVGRALESILEQSFTDFEVVVIDNASTDNSVEVIRQYVDRDPRIRLIINETNQGLAGSLTTVSKALRGRYHVHIDADDWVLDPTAFAQQVGVLEAHPDVSMVYSPITLCYNNNERVVLGPFNEDRIDPGEIALKQALTVQIINTGPMMRMSAFKAFGGYNTDFMHAIDVKLAIDLCGQGSVAYINKPLYAFYQHTQSLNRTSSVAEKQRETVRAIESAFQGPLAGRIPNARKLRQYALGHALTLHATQQIFNNDYRNGWRSLVSGARINPSATLLQPRLGGLLIRTLFGSAGYQRIQNIGRG